MTKSKPKSRSKLHRRSLIEMIRTNLAKILVGLAATGAATGTAYKATDTLTVSQAKTDVKVEQLTTEQNKVDSRMEYQNRSLQRLDRRTTRMEVQQELVMDALKIPRNKRPAKSDNLFEEGLDGRK